MQPLWFGIIESEYENPNMPMGQDLPSPSESRLGAGSHQGGSRPSPPYRCSVAKDDISIIASPKEQGGGTKQEVHSLEQTLGSTRKTTKVVISLIKAKCHLGESPKENGVRREDAVRKYQQIGKAAQALFGTLCEDKADPKCEVEHHKELSDALEESIRVTQEAIHKEAERTQEVSDLREKLRMANNSVLDERKLSRVIAEQVEGLEKLVSMQHSEIKKQKTTIADLKQINKILTEEIGRLQVNHSSVQEALVDTQTELEAKKSTIKIIDKLEEQIKLTEEQTQKLLTSIQDNPETLRQSSLQAILGTKYLPNYLPSTSQASRSDLSQQKSTLTSVVRHDIAARLTQLEFNHKNRDKSKFPNIIEPIIAFTESEGISEDEVLARILELRNEQEVLRAQIMQNILAMDGHIAWFANRPKMKNEAEDTGDNHG